MTGTFEGSYLGADAKISPRAIMECKICWTPYDPAEGDETRQIEPGTPFLALPDDWSCPNCSGAKEQFMVLEDPIQEAGGAVEAAMHEAVERLVAEFHEIHIGKMRDVPFCNSALKVEAVGFQPWQDRFIGVLISPWFMNLVLLPGEADDWAKLRPGEKEMFNFPSGPYEFIDMSIGHVGGFKACSLFSPMAEFKSQDEVVAIARAVMLALFDEANRDDTDKSATIRKQREDEIAAREQAEAELKDALEKPAAAPDRRAVLRGDFSTQAAAEEHPDA